MDTEAKASLLPMWKWGIRGQPRTIAAATITRRRVMCQGIYQQGSWDNRPRLVRLAAILEATIQYRGTE